VGLDWPRLPSLAAGHHRQDTQPNAEKLQLGRGVSAGLAEVNRQQSDLIWWSCQAGLALMWGCFVEDDTLLALIHASSVSSPGFSPD
jgi:hypothetical protein